MADSYGLIAQFFYDVMSQPDFADRVRAYNPENDPSKGFMVGTYDPAFRIESWDSTADMPVTRSRIGLPPSS